jgi:hypothetical protein
LKAAEERKEEGEGVLNKMDDLEPREARQAENLPNNSLILGHFSLRWGVNAYLFKV